MAVTPEQELDLETEKVTDAPPLSSVAQENARLAQLIAKEGNPRDSTPGVIVALEAYIFAISLPFALLMLAMWALLFLPQYEYGKEAIDALINVGYEMGPEECSGNGVDVDADGNQRFVMEYYGGAQKPGTLYEELGPCEIYT